MRCWSKIACAATAAFLSVGAAGAAIFEPLFKISAVAGDVRVFKPGAAESVPAIEQHAYPFGSRIVVPKQDARKKGPQPSASLALANDYKFQLSDGSDITVANDPANPADSKIIEIRAGKLRTIVTISTVKSGGEDDARIEAGINAITVKTPVATATRLTERNLISVEPEDGQTTARFSTESGMMQLSGPQFKISDMKRNSIVEIHGGKDYARITNLAGEFTGEVEKGSVFETVKFKVRSVVKIWRTYAAIGGKMAVAVMIGSPSGAIKSYAFLEGEEVASSTSAQASSASAGSEGAAAFGDQPSASFGIDDSSPEEVEEDEPASQDSGSAFEFNFDF